MAELQNRMGASEFAEWRAFYRIEPFGGRRGDLQSAAVAVTLGNIHRDKKKRPAPFELSDFMIDYDSAGADSLQAATGDAQAATGDAQAATGDAQAARLLEKARAANAALGGTEDSGQ